MICNSRRARKVSMGGRRGRGTPEGSSPRRRGSIIPALVALVGQRQASSNRGSSSRLGCDVWVPAFAGTTPDGYTSLELQSHDADEAVGQLLVAVELHGVG